MRSAVMNFLFLKLIYKKYLLLISYNKMMYIEENI